MFDPTLKKKADEYARQRRTTIHDFLGGGQDGDVRHSGRDTAIKVFHRPQNYCIERDCYQRLGSKNVFSINGLAVPRLLWHDDKLSIIEMSMVSPPRLIDFGKAHIDNPPIYYRDPRDIRRFMGQWQGDFGNRWPDASAILRVLEVDHGIYYLDPNPKNIDFGDTVDDDEWMREPPVDYSAYD